MIWYILASFFPCILVILFSVVTRSKWVGTILVLVLIGASIQKGFFYNEWIIFIDVVSILAGYVIIDQLQLHKKEDED
ncbi:CsbA family protein [Staphylococcus arlettae]|uniref:CsbA family protein n=1 Tax=Staphylococcus arlettae TaxID=29378 RepID=UPI0011A1D8BB|nr:CsbA family protein [Staphylococcus arlettae]